MLQIFQISSQEGSNIQFVALEKIPETAGPPDSALIWINLENPDSSELKDISDRYKLPEDFLSDPLDPAERPRSGHVDDSILIIARASYHSGSSNPGVPLQDEEQYYPTVPIGIIITASAIITVCRIPELVAEILGNKLDNGSSRKRVYMVAKLFEKISTRFIKHLQKLDEISTQIENSMQQATRNKDLRRMMQLSKTLVYFLNALKANALVLEKLLASPTFANEGDEKERLTDAMIECKQAVEMGEVFTQIIANMSEIYASMISNNMNIVIKFLTGITLLLMIPSIIVGIFGMNYPMPFQNSLWALPIIVAGMLLLCWGLWRYFMKKHWM